MTKHVGTANPFFHGFINTIFESFDNTDFISKMQSNAPFCILLKKKNPPPTAFSLSRVGMYGIEVPVTNQSRARSCLCVLASTIC